jgi:UDP-2,3-diacylglucosamine pyrophosphatase LpxH
LRTLVVSDLHLGARSGSDVLRRPGVDHALLDALEGVERLVLLGDTLELRQGTVREVLERARPVLQRLGARLGERPVVLVPGNHDHALAADWLARRAEPLALEQRCAPAAASYIAQACADLLAPAPVELAYPGLWLADGVYAMHGHHLDLHMTVPTLERLAVAGSGRVALAGRRRWDDARSVDDYEAVVAPVYAWAHAAAQTGQASDTIDGGGTVKGWSALTAAARRPLRSRVLPALFPLAVRALNVAGVGPLRSELTVSELRRAGLRAMSEVVERLEIDSRHVVFGHTHRGGMLPDDVPAEWLTPNGVQLHNTGSWVYSPTFSRGPETPYWPGTAVIVDDDAAPRLVRLLTHRSADELAAARPGAPPKPLSPPPTRA